MSRISEGAMLLEAQLMILKLRITSKYLFYISMLAAPISLVFDGNWTVLFLLISLAALSLNFFLGPIVSEKCQQGLTVMKTSLALGHTASKRAHIDASHDVDTYSFYDKDSFSSSKPSDLMTDYSPVFEYAKTRKSRRWF